MAIKKIKISNFKSFKNLEIELGKFNILIGSNASGKSNFLQIFKFLKDINNSGLDNALQMQGGAEYLRNVKIGSSQNFSVEIVFDMSGMRAIEEEEKKIIGIKTFQAIYSFSVKFKKKGLGFLIEKDKLTQSIKFVRLERRRRAIKEKEKIGNGKIVYSKLNGKLNFDLTLPKGLKIKKDNIFPSFLQREKFPANVTLIEMPFIVLPHVKKIFDGISIYAFDPKLPQKASPVTGKSELEEDGSNLSIVLKNIVESRDEKRKFFNLMKEMLPFVDALNVEKFADKSLLFSLKETYSKKHYIPASLISDGTINIAGIIIALYFESKPLTIIEEPERNIHPYLIPKVINMMKDASKNKQIIITTHNPEIVKYADLNDILLVSRDKEGFSTISRPADKKEIKTFLKNEIGMDELFTQNLLEI